MKSLKKLITMAGLLLVGNTSIASNLPSAGWGPYATPPMNVISIPSGSTYSDLNINSYFTAIIWKSTTTSNKSLTLAGCDIQHNGMQVQVVDGAGTSASFPIVATAASGTINDGTSTSLASNGGSFTLVCDGNSTNWTNTASTTIGTASANTIYAGPVSGSSGTPSFRALIPSDLPPDFTVTTGGSANAQTLTYNPALISYTVGQTYSFIAGFTNTGAATLNINGLGAKTIKLNGSDILSGQLVASNAYTVYYDGTNFQLLYIVSPTPSDVNVTSYGAVCDDTADDTIAIQAAINASNGGNVRFPLGKTCKTTSTITVGNGTSSAASTLPGVNLLGTPADNTMFGAFGFTNTVKTTIDYTGSAQAVYIKGPLEGFGINGLNIKCNNNDGTIGLNVISAQYGDVNNLSIYGCQIGIQSSSVSSLPPGVTNVDPFHNRYRNIQIDLLGKVSATRIGIKLTGVSGLSTTDFNHWENVSVLFNSLSEANSTLWGLKLDQADSNLFDDFQFYGQTNGSNGRTIDSMVLDYTVNVANQQPTGNTFRHMSITVGPVVNIGSPNSALHPNWFDELNSANGAIYPKVPGLILDHTGGAVADNGGIWTPQIVGSTLAGTQTYSSQFGHYTLNGYTVHVNVKLILTAFSGATGPLIITGLPFNIDTSTGNDQTCNVKLGNVTLDTNYTNTFGVITIGNPGQILLQEAGSGQPLTTIAGTLGTATMQVYADCTYQISYP